MTRRLARANFHDRIAAAFESEGVIRLIATTLFNITKTIIDCIWETVWVCA